MNTRKYKIQVIDKNSQKVIKDIFRVLRSEMIGNYNPIFCTYNRGEQLVKSFKGDLSDYFRRDKTYGNYLYIEV